MSSAKNSPEPRCTLNSFLLQSPSVETSHARVVSLCVQTCDKCYVFWQFLFMRLLTSWTLFCHLAMAFEKSCCNNELANHGRIVSILSIPTDLNSSLGIFAMWSSPALVMQHLSLASQLTDSPTSLHARKQRYSRFENGVIPSANYGTG